jgi:dihydroflavonol-4-reductase
MGKLSFFIHPKPLAIGKARVDLGYNPETGFKSGIDKALTWYRLNGWL